jgi:hypothetical protein
VIAQARRRMADVLTDDDPTEAEAQMRDANSLEASADALLTLERQPAVGTGGELVPTEAEGPEGSQMVDTVKDPDAATLHASKRRLELASDARCVTLAADMAETVQATKSVEKALPMGWPVAQRSA